MNIIIDETHDSALQSWVTSANGGGDFPIQNLPIGIFSVGHGSPQGGVAIGDRIFDLRHAYEAALFEGAVADVIKAANGDVLNPYLAMPADMRRAFRRRLSAILALGSPDQARAEACLHAAADCAMHLPARIGDYTDFYAGIHHAMNIGKLFRPDNPLLPNYKYVPIGYHGRASSICVSNTPVRRPHGQRKAPDADTPTFGPSMRLDYELEMAIWVGAGNSLGESVPIAEADGHIAGLSLLNDWSARDIQAWEYQPLGPFLSKNFATTLSPWIVTAEALAPYRIAQPPRQEGDPAPLPYLFDAQDQAGGAYAIELEVWIESARMREAGIAPHRLSHGPMSNLYWTAAQMLTQHGCGGCNLQPGDLLGTGTISGLAPDSYGSLMELSAGGKSAIPLPTGESRTFLQDNDRIIITGQAKADGFAPIGFGSCSAVLKPALAL